MEIEDRFQLALEETGIFGSSRCLIAFSGGSDSAALSALCAAVMPGSERVFTAARVSHGIRSWNVEEQETEFCRNFCARIGIPFAALGGTSAVFSSGTGLEAAARNYRYGLLEQHRKETQSDFILFAHTLEDNRETLLMRVLSGSGPEGLKGIPSARGCIRRPLLSFTRGELQEYLQFRGLSWVEDVTNTDSRFLRNRVRHSLVPILEESFPGWRSSADTLIERSGEAARALETARRKQLPMELPADSQTAIWKLSDWKEAEPYLKALSLWKAMNSLEESERRIAWSTVKEARRAADSGARWEHGNFQLEQNRECVMLEYRRPRWNIRHIIRLEDVQGEAFSEKGLELGPGRVFFLTGGENVSFPDFDRGKALRITPDDWPLEFLYYGESRKARLILKALGGGWSAQINRKGNWQPGSRVLYPFPLPDAQENIYYIINIRSIREG